MRAARKIGCISALMALSLHTAAALAVPAVFRLAQDTPAPGGPAQMSTGSDAWTAMIGNTIVGTTPDGEFEEYFKPDGSFVHRDRDGPAPGTWALKDGQVCFAYPDEDEVECRTPELSGHAGAFTGADGARYPFALLPGNPKNL